jgi:hypothetical protein
MHQGHDTESVSHTVGNAAAAGGYAARAFGSSRCDLDLDLSDTDRPAVVTRALAGCLSGLGPAAQAETVVWEWTVAERLQALLAVAVASDDALPLQTRCMQGDCRTDMEIGLDLKAFVADAPRDPFGCTLDGSELVLRLPRGSDQRRWRDAGGDPESLAMRLIESVDGRAPEPGWRVPPDWIEELDAALAERDPLTVLELQLVCPSCGHTNSVAFDLEGWILHLLAEEQCRLIEEVHALAAAYHWSEADICALPPWRRSAYLARLAREDPR